MISLPKSWAVRVGRAAIAFVTLFVAAEVCAKEDGYSQARSVETPLPEFPAGLPKDGRVGIVQVQMNVSETGEVTNARAADLTGTGLDSLCEASARLWRFAPARIGKEQTDDISLATILFEDGKVSVADPMKLPGNVTPLEVIRRVAMVAPPDQLRKQTGGRVLIRVIVDLAGRPSDAKVFESTNRALDPGALDAVKKWRFRPAAIDGHPISSAVLVPLTLNFSDASDSGSKHAVFGKPDESLPEELLFDEAPQPREQVLAVYPYDAAIAGKAGFAELAILIGEEGNVLKTEVRDASAPEFGMALAAAVECWTFESALRGDALSKSLVRYRSQFKRGESGVAFDGDAAALAARIRQGSFKPAKPRELDSPLKPTKMIPPVFPTGRIGQELEGSAVIEIIVDKKGRAVLPKIVKASAPEFGWAAATAAQRWLFVPPTVNDEPVEVIVAIPFKFNAPAKAESSTAS